MASNIAKNTAFMTAASIGQKIISFVYFTMIARMVGVEGTGKYFFALSFTTIFVVFVDLGLTNVFVREAAKMKDKMQTYFSTVLSVKILLGVFSYIAAVIAIHLMGESEEIRNLVYLSAVTMLFDSIHLTLYGSLRAIGDLKYEAISITVSQFLTLILGSVFLYLQLPLIFLILAFTIPSFLNVCYASYIVVKKYNLTLKPHFNKKTFLHLGRIAIPFALAAIFARVYSYMDTVLLKKLVDEVAVGYYSIPYKITFAFQFIPLALVAALYPRFSEFFVKDKKRLAHIFEQAMKYLMLIAFPVAVGIGVLAEDIILTLYTEQYLQSVLPLRILIASLIFSYISFPIGAFLNACNKQVSQTVIVGFVMVVNIILNIMLIPTYGIAGAASAAFMGNALLAILGYLVVPRITKVSHKFILTTLVQVVLSALIMGVAVFYINQMTQFVLAILVGVVVYPAALLFFRTITVKEVTETLAIFKRT
jgi:O-antigen/teichoic acid export membrane protein